MTKRKTIIIIGGGYLQCPQIKWAKEIGLHVVVTDRRTNVPGKELADKFFNLDGTDIQEFVKLANLINRNDNLVGIYSGSDYGLQVVAYISKMLNLPGCSMESVNNALNKSKARTIFEDVGVSIPTGEPASTQDEFVRVAKKYPFPFIVKPTDSCGSQGVLSVWQEKALSDAYRTARKYSTSVIIEEMIIGRHVDVNCLFLDGVFYRCGILDRFFSDPPFHYPIWGKQPSSLNANEEDRVYGLVEKASRAIGINNGPVKADVIYSNRGPYIIELSPRFHGDVSTSFVTTLSTGGSPIKSWFGYLAGESHPHEFIQPARYFGGWVGLFPTSDGILKSITGMEEARKIDGISDVFVSVKEGDVLRKPMDNSSLCGFAWAKSNEPEGLKKTLFDLKRTIAFNISPRLS